MTYDSFSNPEQTKSEYLDTANISIKGFPFPLNRKDSRGFFYRALNHEVIKADLVQLLMTEPGERVMLPEFGTGLRRYMFEAKDALSFEQVKQLIINSITRWEPRIVLGSVDVGAGDDDNRIKVYGDNIGTYSIIISINYALKENLQNVENLVFKFNYNSSNF